MKKERAKKWYTILYAILIVSLVAGMSYLWIKVRYLETKQAHLIEKFNDLEQSKAENSYNETQGQIQFLSFSDEISVSLGVITAGISVFAIFGGVLSVFNVTRSKELEEAIQMSSRAIESQQELESARLIQEGRIYIARKRNKYAIDCYEQAMESAPESFIALVAEYEKLSLFVDELPYSEKNREKIEKAYEQLMRKLEQSRDRRAKQLSADVSFTMGCVYGNYYIQKADKTSRSLNFSEKFLKKAIEYDKSNADFYRNLAVTYALKDDKDACKENLMQARKCADIEDLYAGLVEPQRLKALFESSWEQLSDDMKEMLKKNFR